MNRGKRRPDRSPEENSSAARALVPASFVARPSRLIVVAALADGSRVRAHLADPGRLRELLVPGADLRLRPAPAGAHRATRCTVALVRSSTPPRVWISLDTALPNRLAARLLAAGAVAGVGGGWNLQPEFRRGRSRFDFRLHRVSGAEMLVEVKSVTLVVDGVARFPDSSTARGARHLRELEGVAGGGGRALVLFIVQREDARAMAPNAGIDPKFTAALVSASRAGVLLRAARFRMEPSGPAVSRGPLPVLLR